MLNFQVIAAAVVLLASGSALANESGVQVVVTVPSGQGALPEPTEMVDALIVEGEGKRMVQVRRQDTPQVAEVRMELWGPHAPTAEIANTLRSAFPVLAQAQILVTSLDPSLRPNPPAELEGVEVTTTQLPDGKIRKVIKKRIVK